MSRQGGGYRVGWTVVTGACLAMGAAITVLVDTVGALVLMAIMATAAAFLLAIVLKQADRPGRYVLRSAPVLMLVFTGVNGLAVALGSVTVALVAVLVITGIPVAWQLRNGPARARDRCAAATPPGCR